MKKTKVELLALGGPQRIVICFNKKTAGETEQTVKMSARAGAEIVDLFGYGLLRCVGCFRVHRDPCATEWRFPFARQLESPTLQYPLGGITPKE